MPDIVNPLFSSPTGTVADMPDIPSVIDHNWKSTPISDPPAIKKAIQGIPGNNINLDDFNNLINTNLGTPKQKEDELKSQVTKGVLDNMDLGPIPEILPSRYFKSSDALRYKQNDRLWKTIGYNPELPQSATDAQYDFGETKWEAVKNTLPKFWSTTSFAFKNYFESYVNTAKAIDNIDNMHNSSTMKDYLQEQRDLEDLSPDYKSDRETKWYNFLPFTGGGTGDFWEQMIPSLGFTAGTVAAAAVEQGAIALATGGIGEIASVGNAARKVFKGISEYYSLKRGISLLRGVVGAKNIVGKLGNGLNVWRLMNGALSESEFEGASAASDFLENWRASYIAEHGYAPSAGETETAHEAANKIARSTILYETPFLMMSNAAQFGNIMGGKGLKNIIKELVGEKGMRLGVIGKNIGVIGEKEATKGFKGIMGSVLTGLKGSAWEGTEESYQALVTKATTDYYNDKYFHKDDASIMKSIGAGFDYITSNQGLMEFAGGFATGSLFQHVPKVLNIIPGVKPKLESRMVEDETGQKQSVEDYKLNTLNKLGIGMTEKIKDDIKRRNLQKTANYLNSADVDKIFKDEGFLNLIKSRQSTFAMAKYMENNDLFNLSNVQITELHKLLYTGLTTGKIDLQIKRLQDFATQDFDTVKDAFGDHLAEQYTTKEEQDMFMQSFKEFSNGLSKKAPEFEKIFNNEKEQHKSIIRGAKANLDDSTNRLNYIVAKLIDKYGEKINEEASQEEVMEMYNANEDVKHHQSIYFSAAEAIKASVLSQAGMMEDAKRAKRVIDHLIQNNTVNVPYHDLPRLFDRSERKKRLAALELKMNSPAEAIAGKEDIYKEQYEEFKKLNDLLEEQYKDGKEYNSKQAAAAIQKYYYALEKDVNIIDNNTPLTTRMSHEEAEQLGLLDEYVKLQNRHQENLNMYNMLSNLANRKKYVDEQSKKIRDFLGMIDAMMEGNTEEDMLKELEALTETTLEETPDTGEKIPDEDDIIITGDTNTDPEDKEEDAPPPDVRYKEPHGALAYHTPLKTVNRETDNTNAAGDLVPDEEKTAYSVLREDPYDQDQTDFIVNELPTILKSGLYKAFIVKDTEELQKERFGAKREENEIIIFKNAAGELLRTKKLKLPVAFSFNEKAFDTHLETRIWIRNREENVTDSREFFEQQKAIGLQARDLLRSGKVSEISIDVDPSTISRGVDETTKELVPVAERFGDFEFEVVGKEGKNIGGQIFDSGSTIARIGNQAFEVIPKRISDDTNLTDNISALMAKTYKSREQALEVKAYLNTIVYTLSGKNYFNITPDFRIEYIVNGKKEGMPEIMKSRINIRTYALKDGYKRYYIEKGTLELKSQDVSAEDYYKYIKGILLTNRKRVKKKDGTLFFGNVNAYFNFTINIPEIKEDVFESTEPVVEQDEVDQILNLFPEHIVKQLSKERWIQKIKSSNDFSHLANSVKKHNGITIKRNTSNPNLASFVGKVWDDKELNEIFKEVKEKLNDLENKNTPTQTVDTQIAEINKRRDEKLEALKTGIPAMITRKTEAELKALGVTDEELNKMTPLVAIQTLINLTADAEIAAINKTEEDMNKTEEIPEVKILPEEEYQRIIALDTVYEIEDEGRRIKREGITLNDVQKAGLRARLETLKSAEDEEKDDIEKGIIDEPVTAQNVVTFKFGGAKYVLDFTVPNNNLTGKIPENFEDFQALVQVLKDIPGVEAKMTSFMDFENHNKREVNNIYIGQKNSGQAIVLDSNLKTVSDPSVLSSAITKEFKDQLCK